jgi:hypothetical protein
METSIDAATGQVVVHYTEGAGKEKVLTQTLELQPDIANGLIFTLVKDIEPSAPQTTVSILATTPKPRPVKLAILPESEKRLSSGRTGHKAMVYVMKVEIGGIAGLLARLTGKQPQTPVYGSWAAKPLPLLNQKARCMRAALYGGSNWQRQPDFPNLTAR